MTPFRYRWFMANGDIRMHFWSICLVKKRLFRGLDGSGRELVKVPNGRILF